MMRKTFITLVLGLSALFSQVAQAQLENIKVGTTTRTMLSYAPEKLPYNPPLVISLHGMGQDAVYQKNQCNWEAVADTAKFVVVYPNGLNNGWDISGTTDTKFIEAIIDTMYNRYHINRNRVYVSGFSMGAMMTYHCMAKLSHKVAAFGPVSGIPVDYRNPSGTRPVPIIHTHGTGDNVVYYNGDANHPAGGYGSIPDYVKKWAEFDGCNLTPVVIKPYPKNKPSSAATYTRYANGKDGVEVVLISIKDKGHLHSNDPASVITTQEIWNFCKQYSLGPEEPEPARLVQAVPEEHSFDLPLSGLTFSYVFDSPVDGSKAEAVLSGKGVQVKMNASEVSFSEQLTFLLPEEVELEAGDYSLTIKNVIKENGGTLKSCRFNYTLGVEEVGDELLVQTVLKPDWRAGQAEIGEGIPWGWKRVNSNADGTNDTKESGAANTGGARMKYFQTGGDFDEGFYLSAREYNRCDIYYGAYDGYRLHLLPGEYELGFNAIYWSAGSESGKATFGIYVSDLQSRQIFSQSGLVASGTMNESTQAQIKGSKSYRYTVTVTEEGDYLFGFTAAEGWNSLIVGNLEIVKKPSYADVYKGGFLRMMKRAGELYERTGSMTGVSVELREALKATMDRYEGFTSTAPSQYAAATAELETAILNLEQTTSIGKVVVSEENGREEYYDMAGRRLHKSEGRGIKIIKRYDRNGKVSIEKRM